MSQRSRGISLPQLSILIGPDPQRPETKYGAAAEAGRREVDAMQAIAQKVAAPKPISFGISDPGAVTDMATLRAAMTKAVQHEAESRTGYRFVGRVEMSVADWCDVAPNPRQRDTALHAEKAKHLREYDPIHRFVTMAILADGDKFKIDGHTRAYVWGRNQVQPPESLFVDVYACDSKEIVEALYSKFDSQAAVETGADKIAGAAHRHKLEFKTGMLRAGRYGSALKRLYMYTLKSWGHSWQDHEFVYAAVAHYAAELKLLDQVGPAAKQFPSGITMAALATFKRRGAEALPFWHAYAKGRGVRDGARMDGVQALTEAVVTAKERARGRSGDGGATQQLGLLGKGILAFEAYRLKTTYTAGQKGGVRDMSDKTLVEYLRHTKEA